MAQELRVMLEETGTLGYAMVGTGVLAVLICGLSLVLGVLRGRQVQKLHGALTRGEPPGRLPRFSLAPELLIVCFTLLPLLLAVVTVEHGRGQMLLVRTTAEVPMRASLLAAGIATQLNSLALAGSLMLLLLPLAGTALGFCLGRRFRLDGLRRAAALAERHGADAQEVKAWHAHPGPGAGHLLPVTAGLGVVSAALAFGFVSWCTGIVRAFSAIAGVDPARKAKLFIVALDEVRPSLERLPPVLGGASIMVATAAFLLLQVFSPARRRHAMAPSLPATPQLSWTGTLVAAGGCLIAALVSALLALPYRQENLDPRKISTQAIPWPAVLLKSLRGGHARAAQRRGRRAGRGVELLPATIAKPSRTFCYPESLRFSGPPECPVRQADL